ncbi:MAG: hypothetical protein AAFP04_16095, partial [Myxococcota bacterium]
MARQRCFARGVEPNQDASGSHTTACSRRASSNDLTAQRPGRVQPPDLDQLPSRVKSTGLEQRPDRAQRPSCAQRLS